MWKVERERVKSIFFVILISNQRDLWSIKCECQDLCEKKERDRESKKWCSKMEIREMKDHFGTSKME